MTSIEWQAVAAAEGFASAYSMATWHDLFAGSLPFFYVTPISHGGLAHFDVPATNPRCQLQSCSAGTGNEWDWMTALILFLRDASQPTFAHVLGMNAAAHDDACIGLGQGPCTSAPTCTWSTHADAMCVGWPVSGQSSLGRPRKRGLVVGWSRPAGCADSRDIAVRLVAAYESRFTRRRTGGSRGAGLLEEMPTDASIRSWTCRDVTRRGPSRRRCLRRDARSAARRLRGA